MARINIFLCNTYVDGSNYGTDPNNWTAEKCAQNGGNEPVVSSGGHSNDHWPRCIICHLDTKDQMKSRNKNEKKIRDKNLKYSLGNLLVIWTCDNLQILFS